MRDKVECLSAKGRLNRYGYYIHIKNLTSEIWTEAHTHEFCEFFLVVEGAVRQVLNGQESVLPAGSLQMIFANDIHSLECANNRPCTFYNIHIGKTRFQKDLAFFSDLMPINIGDCVQRIAPLPKYTFLNLRNKIEQLLGLDQTQPLAGALFRLLTVEVIWLLAARTGGIGDEQEAPEWLRQVFVLMHRPENSFVGLPRMIELSGRSPEHLSRTFRTYYGMTPREFILELRLHVAAELLERGMPVTAAASRAGFQNLSYFRRVFSARFAMLPLRYSKECGSRYESH